MTSPADRRCARRASRPPSSSLYLHLYIWFAVCPRRASSVPPASAEPRLHAQVVSPDALADWNEVLELPEIVDVILPVSSVRQARSRSRP